MKPKIGKFSTISKDVVFGKDVIVHGHANLYGCRIGDNSRIGTFVEIQRDVTIGKRVRVQSHSFICSNVTIEDDVFIGHNVNFINDRYPTAEKAASGKWLCEGIMVRKGASIGTGSVIMCGVEIGEGAVIGAGSVVLKSAPPHTVTAGVPAKIIRLLPPEEHCLGGE
jgi:acetyltransferase-like isoleucine patch superfamily enzyme